jgi:hypothetical protein
MQIEICCPRCFGECAIGLATGGDALLEQVLEGAPGYALGDGETFEDMISSTLADHEPMHCPRCGAVLKLSEENLGQLAMSMLARM